MPSPFEIPPVVYHLHPDPPQFACAEAVGFGKTHLDQPELGDTVAVFEVDTGWGNRLNEAAE